MQIVVNGLLTSYKKTGSGNKTILCIHGWADSKKTFDTLSSKLETKYTVISLDLPGFGETETPDKAWSLNDFSDFINAFLRKLKIEPFALIGHSNGGAIAINGLSNSVLRADKLVLIASAGVRNPGSLRNKTLKIAAKPAKVAISLAPKKTQEQIKKKLYKSIGSDYLIAENMKETFKNIVSADILNDASRLKQPTVLICGDQDESTPVSIGRKINESLKDSKLYVINHAGHFVHQQKPDKVASIIEDFLR